MATQRRVCGRCSGSGWVDANYIRSGWAMGPGAPGNMSCSGCGGTGTIETWVPDPRPKGGGGKDRGNGREAESGGQVQPRGRSLPGVDRWFERHFPFRARLWATVICPLFFAVVATDLAESSGLGPDEATAALIAGLGAGFLLPWLIVPIVKLAIVALITGAMLWAAYYLWAA